MIIAAEYPFNGGRSIENTHTYLLQEVEQIIAGVDASLYKIKESKELTMQGKKLYSPSDLNRAFAQGFGSKGWQKKRVMCHFRRTTTDPNIRQNRCVQHTEKWTF